MTLYNIWTKLKMSINVFQQMSSSFENRIRNIMNHMFMCIHMFLPVVFVVQSVVFVFRNRKWIYYSSTWQCSQVLPVNFVSCDRSIDRGTSDHTYSHDWFHSY